MIRPVLEGDLGKATATAAASHRVLCIWAAGLGSIFAAQQDAGAIVALMAVLAIELKYRGVLFRTLVWTNPAGASVGPAKTVEGLLGGMLSALVLILAGEAEVVTASRPHLLGWACSWACWGRLAIWRKAFGSVPQEPKIPAVDAPWDRRRARCVGFPDVRRPIRVVDDERIRHRRRDRLDSCVRPWNVFNHHFRRSELQ